MTDAERLAAAITLAIFFHFLLIFVRTADPEAPLSLSITLSPEDTSVIAASAPKSSTGISTAPSAANEEAEQRDKKRRVYLEYLEEVDNAIHARRFIDGNRDLIGTVLYGFAIMPDGTFANIRLLKSSGEKKLDDAAFKAIRAASAVVKRPGILGAEPLEVSLWIKFQYGLE